MSKKRKKGEGSKQKNQKKKKKKKKKSDAAFPVNSIGKLYKCSILCWPNVHFVVIFKNIF